MPFNVILAPDLRPERLASLEAPAQFTAGPQSEPAPLGRPFRHGAHPARPDRKRRHGRPWAASYVRAGGGAGPGAGSGGSGRAAARP